MKGKYYNGSYRNRFSGYSYGSTENTVAWSCEHGNEFTDSINARNFLS